MSRTPLDLGAFEAITFDCYGTLIDWESGLAAALRPVLAARGVIAEPEEILALHARLEPRLQRGPYQPYRQILGQVVEAILGRYGLPTTVEERASLAESVRDWPPFSDAPGALSRLAGGYRLAILSNIDDDLLDASVRRLGPVFECLVTAQQVRSYKPAKAHFEAALERLRLPAERVLHVAQSRFHDIAPAAALGWATVWVNRRGPAPGGGATPESDARADLEVPNLATLADLVA